MIVVVVTLAAGALGAVLRFLVSRAFGARAGVAVLVVNVVGSAIGGLVYGLAVIGDLDAGALTVILTGFCGGLTTFSTFSVETVQLVMAGKGRMAALSVAANLVLGIGSAALTCAAVILTR